MGGGVEEPLAQHCWYSGWSANGTSKGPIGSLAPSVLYLTRLTAQWMHAKWNRRSLFSLDYTFAEGCVGNAFFSEDVVSLLFSPRVTAVTGFLCRLEFAGCLLSMLPTPPLKFLKSLPPFWSWICCSWIYLKSLYYFSLERYFPPKNRLKTRQVRNNVGCPPSYPKTVHSARNHHKISVISAPNHTFVSYFLAVEFLVYFFGARNIVSQFDAFW